jgi:glycosyltransferase involved in cell wall biosynthesis
MEIEGLMMRGKFAYDPSAMTLRTRITAQALKNTPIDIVHHLDPIVYDYLRQHFAELACRLRLLPEPVENMKPLDARAARAKLGISPTGSYLGCLGALSAVKGVALLLKAFADAPVAADARLLLIGKPDVELRLLLDNEYRGLCEAGRIIHIDRYVSQEEFHLGLMASDVVCVPYHRQIGSSGVVVRAAAVGRPLLGSDFGWIGRVIRDFELGIVCDVTDTPRFAVGIAAALASSSSYRQGPKAQAFSNFHCLENFERHWTRRLRERLGLGMPRKLSAWEWPESA